MSGTTIGAGMLAFPVSTGLAGFYPSLLLLTICWAFMTFTAFLMLEVNLWMGQDANLISMARRTLGRGGEIFSWLTYLFLLYALTTAYIAGSGPIVVDIVQSLTGLEIPHSIGSIPLLLLFGFFVYKGTASVDYLNRILMIGLTVAYFSMVTFLLPHVDSELLKRVEWGSLALAVSVVVTSFGFHIIIPSLTTYLERDVPKLRLTLLIGSVIPFVVYLIWTYVTLGIIPLEEEYGLIQGYVEGSNGAHLLSKVLDSPVIAITARFFAFFAIVTSFLGVSLSLSDFLADGLKIKKTRSGRILLYGLTFLPPLVFSLTDPRAFLNALEYAGAFGVITLLALLPALMVWRGRYHYHFSSTFRTPGGKGALLLVIAFSLCVIGLELAHRLGFYQIVTSRG